MKRTPQLIARAAALAAAMLISCGDDGKPAGTDATPIDLTGQWTGTYDDMAVRQTGDSITAVYEYRCGRISGTVSGTRVQFLWWENAAGLPYDSASPDARGDGYFDVVAQGDSLVGKWRFEGAPLLDRDWVAVRLSHTADSATIVETCAADTADTSDDTTGSSVTDTGPPPPAGVLRSTDTLDDLLFQIADSGGEAIYYRGRDSAGSMDLTHITYRDSAGNLYGAIVHEFLPVQWVMEGMSIAVYRLDQAEPFDPTQAVHVYVSDTLEDSLVLDIYPADLDTTIARMERLAGRTFAEARQFLASHSITSFSQLTSLAASARGNAQIQAVSAAAAFGMGASAWAISGRFYGLGKRQSALGLEAAFKPAAKVAAAALGSLLDDLFGPGSTGDNGPTVGVLLCQGAAKYGVCHYMFFRADQLGDCVRLCQTSLGCFTDICMPMEISWADANGFNTRQFGP